MEKFETFDLLMRLEGMPGAPAFFVTVYGVRPNGKREALKELQIPVKFFENAKHGASLVIGQGFAPKVTLLGRSDQPASQQDAVVWSPLPGQGAAGKPDA